MFLSDIVHIVAIYNPVTMSYEVWDGSLSVGGVTIGQVDQGVAGADPWLVTSATLATAAKQDTLLAELQLKADLAETQPVSIAGTVAVSSGTLATALNQTSLNTLAGSVVETAPATDTAASGLNGRLQRIAQRLTSLIALFPTTLGQGTMATSLKVVLPSDQASIPVTAVAGAALALDASIGTLNTAVNTLLKPANTLAAVTTVGTVTAVTAITNPLPAGTNAIGKLAANDGVDIGNVDVASSALPTGAATETTLGTRLTETDFDTKIGSLTETAPATDTASSGLNGRLQRIAQRITSLITALGSPFQAGGSIGNTTFGATVTSIAAGITRIGGAYDVGGTVIDEVPTARVVNRAFINASAGGNTELVAAQGASIRVRVLAVFRCGGWYGRQCEISVSHDGHLRAVCDGGEWGLRAA